MFKKYWDDYYRENPDPNSPSPFARFVSKYLSRNNSLLELGCGNGRDSLFFADKLDLEVTGMDQCKKEIDFLTEKYERENLEFVTGDFTRINIDKKFDNVYSRFTLHSVDEDGENRTIHKTYENLNRNGTFFVEARSIRDDLYGKGKQVGKHEFVTDHYRRFIDKNVLIRKLKKNNFSIIQSVEDRGLAVYKDRDPVIVRVIAEKVGL